MAENEDTALSSSGKKANNPKRASTASMTVVPPKRSDDMLPPTEIPSVDAAFNAIIFSDVHASSADTAKEFVDVVENSKHHKDAYERDLVYMMMLSCERRFKWQSNYDFFAATISFLIGYDATFAFLRTFERVGLTIVIPFSVLLLCYGIPIMYLELALGQYCSLDSSLIFKRMAPAFTAIGYLSWLIAFISIISSQGIIALCIDLIVSTFAMLRDNYVYYRNCHKFYNTEYCMELDASSSCVAPYQRYYNGGCLNTMISIYQLTYMNELFGSVSRDDESTAEYLQMYLGGYIDAKIPFNPSVHVVLWLAVSWLVLAVIARRGTSFVVKMSYVTMAALLFLVVILFLSGVWLGNTGQALRLFFEMRSKLLFEPVVWVETFVYISICMKIGQGGLITLGSYNDFHSNIFRNLITIIISSFLCPIVVAFSLTPLYNGFLHRLLVNGTMNYDNFAAGIKDFQEFEGVSMTASSLMLFKLTCVGLIFIFAICMLFLILGNQMMRITLLISSLREHFQLLTNKFYLNAMIMALCVLGCLLQFIFSTTCGSSIYIVTLGLFLPLACSALGMMEVLTIAYVYGSKKFFSNISAMLFSGKLGEKRRRQSGGLWRMIPYFNGYMVFCWRYLTPMVVVLFICSKLALLVGEWNSYLTHLQMSIVVGFVLTYAVIGYVPVDCCIKILYAKLRRKPIIVLFKPHLLLFGPRKPRDRRLAQRQEERLRI